MENCTWLFLLSSGLLFLHIGAMLTSRNTCMFLSRNQFFISFCMCELRMRHYKFVFPFFWDFNIFIMLFYVYIMFYGFCHHNVMFSSFNCPPLGNLLVKLVLFFFFYLPLLANAWAGIICICV